METIAVYWEPIIQVYGFDSRKDIALLELDFSITEADYWGECIDSLATTDSGFIMVLAQYISTTTLRFCIALQKADAISCRQQLEKSCNTRFSVSIRLHQPVDILFFHGPHFQDRYGIAETVFRSLQHSPISLHAVGCTGTSVYLALNTGEIEQVKELLSEGFTVPDYTSTTTNR